MSHDDRLATPDAKRSYNRELFTIIAPEYDRITPALSFFGDKRWKRILVQNLRDCKEPTIIDFACGTGDLFELLSSKYTTATIAGADIVLPMLLRAKVRLHNRGKIFLSQSDMHHPPFKTGCASLVTGGYALRNAPDLATFLCEIHRIMTPGGMAGFLDFSRSSNFFMSRLQCRVLELWGGLWGLLLHGRPAVYGYIGESLRRFPDRKTLEQVIQKCGFEKVTTRTFYFGTLAMVTFRKPVGNN